MVLSQGSSWAGRPLLQNFRPGQHKAAVGMCVHGPGFLFSGGGRGLRPSQWAPTSGVDSPGASKAGRGSLHGKAFPVGSLGLHQQMAPGTASWGGWMRNVVQDPPGLVLNKPGSLSPQSRTAQAADGGHFRGLNLSRHH